MQQARGAEDRSGHASPIVKDTRRLGGALVENSEKLSTELDQLRKKQLDALADETFVGLTDQELFQYDQRLERIHELYAKLRKLKDAA